MLKPKIVINPSPLDGKISVSMYTEFRHGNQSYSISLDHWDTPNNLCSKVVQISVSFDRSESYP